MIFNNIKVQNEGYVYCKSNFYSAQDVLIGDLNYTFSTGINRLSGEIDSGIWAISYLLSMYTYRPKDFILFGEPNVIINNESFDLSVLSKHSCYMDKLYPLFSSNATVKKIVLRGLNYSKLDYSPNDVKDLFHIDNNHFEQSLACAGNETFKAMAAIGYCYNKEIFCFPWLSNKRFKSYHENLSILLETLESLKKVVIIPIGEK